MAKYDMHGAPSTAMAEFVRKASLVMLCVSASYDESQYCRAEANMAMQLRKKLVVLVVDEKYDPMKSDKLFSILAEPMRINCCNDMQLVENTGKIFIEIEKAMNDRSGALQFLSY